MTPPDKRRAMMVYLRDIVDRQMRNVGSMAQGVRESGDDARADIYLSEQRDWQGIFNIMAAVVVEYDEGKTGKYGLSKGITNIISAGESAYYKEKKA